MKLHQLSSALALLIPITTYAAPFYEVHGGGGISSLELSNASIRVTSSEVDTLKHKDDWNTGIAQLGVGMAMPFRTNSNNYLNNIRLELNGYYVSDTLKGPVFRFDDPEFSDYNYRISARSMRLMLDGVLNVATFNNVSVFAKAGLGESWNRANYRDAYIGSAECAGNTISTSSQTHGQFAWEAGAGVQYNFNQQLGVAAEYLYADLGRFRTGFGSGSGCLASTSAARFDLVNQSAQLTLHYTFA